MLTQLHYIMLILNNLDGEPHPDAAGIPDLLRAIEEEFLITHGYYISTYGRQYAVKEWLTGLPTALSLPFYYDHITKWAEEILNRELEEHEELFLHATYWDAAAKTLINLFDLNNTEG